jgi:hypothetical protein
MDTTAKLELATTPADLGSDGLAQTLRRAILALPPESPLLKLAASHGGIIQDGVRDATVLRIARQGTSTTARVGIFFTEVVGGCSCGDEPFTADGYCELLIRVQEGRSEAEVGFA